MPAPSPQYYVYIMACNDGTLYTGITVDLERRLRQHNGERKGGARYTRGKGPIELAYSERYKTRGEAARREYHIKHRLSRQEKQELIERGAE